MLVLCGDPGMLSATGYMNEDEDEYFDPQPGTSRCYFPRTRDSEVNKDITIAEMN